MGLSANMQLTNTALIVLAALEPCPARFGGEGRGGNRHDRLLPAPSGKPPAGRNQQCPCGSGKKYKACCRRRLG